MAFIAWSALVTICSLLSIVQFISGQCGIDSCNTCVNPGITCEVCESGYIPSSDQSSCLACPEHCTTCVDADADGVTECTDCDWRFFVDDGQCSFCPGHCSECTSTFQCTTCNSRYKLQDGEACAECSHGCDVCSDGTLTGCFDCADGFYLVPTSSTSLTGSCGSCPTACAKCTSGTSCDTCNTGKTWNANLNLCTECVSNCDPSHCTTTEGCTQCAAGYFLAPDEQACRVCSFCEEDSCLNGIGCTKCLSGYILNEDLTCHACLDIDGDGDTCRSCGSDTRGRIFLDNQCQYCKVNCLECTSPDVCLRCAAGYFVQTGGTCVACHSDCATCHGSTNIACDSCKVGRGMNVAEGTCVVCDDAVNECDECTETVCESCTAGFYLYSLRLTNDEENVNGECRGCPANSTYLNIMNEVCVTCGGSDILGKYLTSSPCQDCGTNCLSCTSTGVCVQCDTNSFITTTGTCEVIGSTTVPDFCLIMQQYQENTIFLVTCQRCLDNYYYDGANCMPDMVDSAPSINGSACLIYSTSDTTPADGVHCLRCEDDMIWDFDTGYFGDCVPDEPAENCEVWNVPTSASIIVTCAVCDPGYFLVDASNSDSIDGQTLTSGDCVQHTDPVANCNRYSSADECSECNAGFYLDPLYNTCIECSHTTRDQTSFICDQCKGSGLSDHATYQSWRGECLSCPSSCVKCSAPASCDVCRDDTYWDVVTSQCIGISCGNLADIETGEHCLKCKTQNINSDVKHQGLAWIDHACVECARNCESCDGNIGVCAECRDGYFWSSASQMCVECRYESESACTNCVHQNSRGHYFNSIDLTCNSCDEECISCSSTACTACSSRFYLGPSTNNCQTCSTLEHTEDSCTKCNNGGYFSPPRYWIADESGNLDCRSCPGDCVACNSAQSCAKCEDAKYFNEGLNSCQECMFACETCTEVATCTKCIEGYTFNTLTSSCETCPTNCDVCTHEDGCTECAEMFYSTVNGQCDSCSDALPNCNKCSSTVTDETISIDCTECFEGFYTLTTTGITCAECITGCAECSGETGCTRCATGYCLDTTADVCRYVSTGFFCSECQLSEAENLMCTTCNPGFFLELCKGCDSSYCKTCDTHTSVCSSCGTGSYRDTELNTCIACLSNCDECLDSTTCRTCSSGRYWNTADETCTRCPSGCTACSLDEDTGLKCDTCSATNQYKHTTAQTCHDCFTNCETCNAGDTCTGCITGYRLVFNAEGTAHIACTACPTGCARCTLDVTGEIVTCNACKSDYMKLEDGTCLACDSGFGGCGSCTNIVDDVMVDANECDACEEGYFFGEEGDKCESCSISNCATCVNNPEVCTICDNDMYPTENGTECGAPCYACTGDSCEQYVASTANNTNPNITAVGCLNGCWVSKNETGDEVTWYRGCNNDHPSLSCRGFETQMCLKMDQDMTTYCARCCSDSAYCNTFDIEQSSATLGRATTILIILSLIYLIIVNNCL